MRFSQIRRGATGQIFVRARRPAPKVTQRAFVFSSRLKKSSPSRSLALAGSAGHQNTWRCGFYQNDVGAGRVGFSRSVRPLLACFSRVGLKGRRLGAPRLFGERRPAPGWGACFFLQRSPIEHLWSGPVLFGTGPPNARTPPAFIKLVQRLSGRVRMRYFSAAERPPRLPRHPHCFSVQVEKVVYYALPGFLGSAGQQPAGEPAFFVAFPNRTSVVRSLAF